MSITRNLNSMLLLKYAKTGKTPLRVCVINFTGERRNWGCQATSWELIRVLNRLWPHTHPFLLDVVPLLPHHSLDKEISTNYGNDLRKALLNTCPTNDQKELVQTICRRRYLHYVDVVKRADLIIFQAEGTMTGTDFLRAERLLLLPWLAIHVFKKSVISLNQTIFSANDAFSQTLLTVLNSFSEVWVREMSSYRWLKNNGLKNTCIVPDTAFLTDPLDHGNIWKLTDGRQFFCVTGSAALFEGDIPRYLDSIFDIAKITGLFPIFLCSTGRDLLLIKYAKERWSEEDFGKVKPSEIYPAIAHCLGKASFLIGGRYHLSILAAISGTPSVLIKTNTYKLNGLVELLGTDWAIREAEQKEDLISDACQCLKDLGKSRPLLKLRVEELRSDIINAFNNPSQPRTQNSNLQQDIAMESSAQQDVYLHINQKIALSFKYPRNDTLQAKLGRTQQILPQLKTLTVYLRRNKQPEATFCCLRQLVQGNFSLVLKQLNSRWLVSICDSYTDFGRPVEARNALLISTFMNWERLAASYIHWAEPNRETRRVKNFITPQKQHLWDGLTTVQLTRGDTTNNLFIRYAILLESTPYLLKIWRTLLDRIKINDSVMSALNAPHGNMFEESLTWINNENIQDIPPWRKF